jgi:two-component system, cell cycle response regulator
VITETNYKKRQIGIEAQVLCDDGRGLTENFLAQLEEARFISSFMAAVCTSLELDGICSIAARALYTHAPYCRIVFAFSAELESKTVVFSPMAEEGMIAVRPKITVCKTCSPSLLPEESCDSAHFNLHDNLGTIAIHYKAGQGKTFSASLHANIEACFSQAIRNALQHSRMKDLAMRDGLTGLFNRRIFDETLAQQAKSPNMRPVSLLLFDLDNFKQVNDTYGHQSGDQVLKSFARILKESCRGHDLIARFGGEEFAIILSQTKAATAHAIAQRIRNRLAKTVFTFEGRQIQITASIGLATCQKSDTIFTANLVKQADQALYQAKRTGKNKVCMFPSDLLMDDSLLSLGGENFCPLASASC